MIDHCSNCGKRRRPVETPRKSWRFDPGCPITPRSEGDDVAAVEICAQLIIHAHIYRNGGAGDDTHLCDDCLRVGLRIIKAEVDRLLDEPEAEKDAKIASLTKRVGLAEHGNWTRDLDIERLRRELGAARAAGATSPDKRSGEQ